jgi:hypothetical protein
MAWTHFYNSTNMPCYKNDQQKDFEGKQQQNKTKCYND